MGVSTIISFESMQREPISANRRALEQALTAAGVIFLQPDADTGHGVKLMRTTEAMRDLLQIGTLKEPEVKLAQRAQRRIEQFCADARAFYVSVDSRDPEIDERVRSDCFKLRDRVDEEIDRRARLERDDASTRFLELVHDQLHR